ncbi:unnamed protein product (macronuclear) [Paramecium tetraurelia]|uniref:Transmembrane protein n=1 Tax=Paramecium tetraurelia TaxID=5888 RepID=A0EDD5_PARTE|nr:uncharacterized protein GSPATT00004171001 [Paramecium tetraurelia]CAK93302.1 unnamed protein product [Paramecium tetraurelia]|eukprot:XP_001460699.1 hypothetical protein (macronuclear) [Paramecium tetraurelia strain d4-2]
MSYQIASVQDNLIALVEIKMYIFPFNQILYVMRSGQDRLMFRLNNKEKEYINELNKESKQKNQLQLKLKQIINNFNIFLLNQKNINLRLSFSVVNNLHTKQ